MAIIAAGGDGTINTIIQELIFSKTALGIIPMGSGNGLANELGISKNLIKNIKIINNANIKHIDAAKVNNRYFINVAGTGFDADIGYLFQSSKIRGFLSYFIITVKHLFNFKHKKLKLIIDKTTLEFNKLFLATAGNGTQYGNKIFITPDAKISDGLLNLQVISNLNLINAIKLIYAVLFKNFKHCKNFCNSYVAKEFILIRENNEAVNIDGESEMMDKKLYLSILPNAIKVILP